MYLRIIIDIDGNESLYVFAECPKLSKYCRSMLSPAVGITVLDIEIK